MTRRSTRRQPALRRFGVADAAIGAVLLVVAYLTLYPFLKIAFSSMSDPQEILRNRSVDLKTLAETVLARFPGGRAGMCSLSADGGRLVTGVARGGRHALAAIDTGGSGYNVVCEPPRPVGHAMVCPADRDLILYTSGVDQRMWLAAAGRGDLRPLHRHDRREWITHKSFLGSTDQVIFARWPFALMAIGVDDREARVWWPTSTRGTRPPTPTARS